MKKPRVKWVLPLKFRNPTSGIDYTGEFMLHDTLVLVWSWKNAYGQYLCRAAAVIGNREVSLETNRGGCDSPRKALSNSMYKIDKSLKSLLGIV